MSKTVTIHKPSAVGRTEMSGIVGIAKPKFLVFLMSRTVGTYCPPALVAAQSPRGLTLQEMYL